VRSYYVYLMASRSRVLYTGVTNDLTRRVREHKQGLFSIFTTKYHVTRLVYFEDFLDIRDAIAREKEIKGWRRSRKIDLINARNPIWEDLAENWFLPSPPPLFF
jgi:putative endonuclease